MCKLIDAIYQLSIKEVPSGIYNLVGNNFEILDLVDVFKELYPSLEFIFINQHLDLRDLRVEENIKLKQYLDIPDSDLKSEILEMREKSFAFSSVDLQPA